MKRQNSTKIDTFATNFTKDLIILTADKNAHDGIEGLLSKRQESLGISLKYDIFTHLERDPGCYLRGSDYLSGFSKQYRYALIIFDYEGCGNKADNPEEIEKELETQLSLNGWKERSAVIVVNPEIDVWLWSDSPHVSEIIGWKNQPVELKQWLLNEGFITDLKQVKPERPKEALEAAMKKTWKPRSSSIYKGIAEKVSLKGCQDRAFGKFIAVLSKWFGHKE